LLNNYRNKLFLNIIKSKTLTALLLGSHVGAVLITAGLAVPLGWRAVVILVLAFSLRVQWRTVARAAGALRLEPDGVCILTNVSGALRGHVTGATVFPLFVRLVVTGDGRRSRTLLVMRDAVTPDGYRSLRARIVQRHLPVPASQPPV